MEMPIPIYIIIPAIAIVLWNILTFALYGMDKAKAKANKWRISEATLIGFAFLMGGIGSLFGMSVFRHKTQHIKFKLLVPIGAILNIAIIAAALLWYFIY